MLYGNSQTKFSESSEPGGTYRRVTIHRLEKTALK